MEKRVLWNVLLNLVLAAIFVWLNVWALRNGLEETFVTLAIFYGLVVIVGNAFYASQSLNNGSPKDASR